MQEDDLARGINDRYLAVLRKGGPPLLNIPRGLRDKIP